MYRLVITQSHSGWVWEIRLDGAFITGGACYTREECERVGQSMITRLRWN